MSGFRRSWKKTPSLTPARSVARDKLVGLCSGDVERLLDEHVEAARGGGDPLIGVQRRRAADGDEVHRPVVEKRFEAVERDTSVELSEAPCLRAVSSVDRRDLDARDCEGRARVRVADVSGAEDADSDRHSAGSGSRFRVQGSGFKVQVQGFRVQGSGKIVRAMRSKVLLEP